MGGKSLLSSEELRSTAMAVWNNTHADEMDMVALSFTNEMLDSRDFHRKVRKWSRISKKVRSRCQYIWEEKSHALRNFWDQVPSAKRLTFLRRGFRRMLCQSKIEMKPAWIYPCLIHRFLNMHWFSDFGTLTDAVEIVGVYLGYGQAGISAWTLRAICRKLVLPEDSGIAGVPLLHDEEANLERITTWPKNLSRKYGLVNSDLFVQVFISFGDLLLSFFCRDIIKFCRPKSAGSNFAQRYIF